MKKILILLSILFLIVSIVFIQTQKSKPLISSFYHWENTYNQKDSKEKLYIKVLDIAYSTKMEAINTKFLTKPKKQCGSSQNSPMSACSRIMFVLIYGLSINICE